MRFVELAEDLRASTWVAGSLAEGGRRGETDGPMTNGGKSMSGPTSNDMSGVIADGMRATEGSEEVDLDGEHGDDDRLTVGWCGMDSHPLVLGEEGGMGGRPSLGLSLRDPSQVQLLQCPFPWEIPPAGLALDKSY